MRERILRALSVAQFLFPDVLILAVYFAFYRSTPCKVLYILWQFSNSVLSYSCIVYRETKPIVSWRETRVVLVISRYFTNLYFTIQW